MAANEYVYVLRCSKLVKVRVIAKADDGSYIILSTRDMQLPLWWPINLIVIVALTAYYLIHPRTR